MATPFIRTDANGRILAVSEKGDASVGAYLDTLRAGTIASTFELATHAQSTEEGSLGTETEDVIEVELTAGQTYTFAYRGTVEGGIEDPYLALFGVGGTYITEDDDGGLGRSSQITYTATQTGTHYLLATSWYHIDPSAPGYPDYRDSGDYTINIWSPDPAHDAPATLAGAVEIEAGTTYGYLDSATDRDMYKIEVTEGMVYSFTYNGGVSGGADFDGEAGENLGILRLYDSAGVNFAAVVNYETGVNFFAEESGTYYVRAESYQGTTGGYTLDVQEIDPATRDPLESLNWDSAANVPFADTDGDGVGDTAYVYFAPAGENFGETEPDGVTPMTTYGWEQFQIDGVMNALGEYERILGINYEITTDVTQATFRMLTTENLAYGARFYPQDPSYGDQAGIGTFNLISGGFGSRPESLVQGGFSYAVVLHEFGHAHGIAHPHDTGGGSEVMLGVTASTGSYGVYNLNQGVYTVMSYNDAWDFHPDGPTTEAANGSIGAVIDHGWSGTLSAFDIAVLQERYGVTARNEGNNTYELNDDYATAYYQTIWDSAGNDTISYGGDLDAQIDLTAATLDYSPTGGGVLSFLYNEAQPDYTTEIKGGYTIANGVVIENATGGSGDDALIGNAAGNRLTGNDGNDTLLGRDGADNLFGGAGDDVLNGGSGKNDLTGGAGNDVFVFEDASSTDKIRDFDSGNDVIDLTAFGIDSGDVKITGGKLFADTDGVGGYDLQIVVQGDKVQMSDIMFGASELMASSAGAGAGAGGGGLAPNQDMVIV